VRGLQQRNSSACRRRSHAARIEPLERFPIGQDRPVEKKTLKIKKLEHVLVGKVDQLVRNML
jgi:hypothetical protein